jgi:hypothetical protein
LEYDLTDPDPEQERIGMEIMRDEANAFVESLRAALDAAGLDIKKFDVQDREEP